MGFQDVKRLDIFKEPVRSSLEEDFSSCQRCTLSLNNQSSTSLVLQSCTIEPCRYLDHNICDPICHGIIIKINEAPFGD